MSSDQREQFQSGMRQFIQIELETGMTFASIALESRTEETRRQRNRQNARKAYDTANHFLNEHAVGQPVIEPNLLAQLAMLRGILIQLGERFAE
jgi:hypothetical protein